MLIWELTLVALLILLNGFFAMSEIAGVSARRARLQHMARAGTRGARRALRLAADPTGFLSTVQVGITLVGIFAGAYGGATLAIDAAALVSLTVGSPNRPVSQKPVPRRSSGMTAARPRR